ncbi:oligosaccharide flippase family protein [Pluralibacter gergoviae]|nr:oligosaccharide flippase family protein [Pluralibacter gergoviae]
MSKSDYSLNTKPKFSGVLWYLLSNIFPALSSFLIFTLSTRTISPEGLGAVALSTTIITLLVSLSAIGFGDALIQQQRLSDKHISSVFTLVMFLGSGLWILSVFFTYLFGGYISEVFKHIYFFLSIRILFDVSSIVPLAMLTRKMEFKAIGKRTIICSILSFIACLPLVHLKMGLMAIIVSQLTTSITSCIILWYSLGFIPKLHFERSFYDDLKSFGLHTTFTKILGSLNIDNLCLGILGNLTTLGIYGFSKRIFSVFSDFINSALSNVSFPLFSKYQDNSKKLSNLFLSVVFLSVAVSLPVFVGSIIIAPRAIPFFFGTQWIDAIDTVRLFFIFGFISCIGVLQLSVIKSLGRTRWVLSYQIFQQVTTGLIALIFAKYGATTVILLIVIKTYLTWPYTIFYTSSVLNISIGEYLKNIYKPFVAVSIMYFCHFLIIDKLPELDFLNYLVVSVFICGVIYTTSLYLMAKNELYILLKIIRK